MPAHLLPARDVFYRDATQTGNEEHAAGGKTEAAARGTSRTRSLVGQGGLVGQGV